MVEMDHTLGHILALQTLHIKNDRIGEKSKNDIISNKTAFKAILVP